VYGRRRIIACNGMRGEAVFCAFDCKFCPIVAATRLAAQLVGPHACVNCNGVSKGRSATAVQEGWGRYGGSPALGDTKGAVSSSHAWKEVWEGGHRLRSREDSRVDECVFVWASGDCATCSAVVSGPSSLVAQGRVSLKPVNFFFL
jgi:hypothetical protein